MTEFEPTQSKKSGKVTFANSIIFQNRTLLAVSLSVFAAYTGIGMVVPVRVLYAESRGASLAIISAMASAYLVSNFVFQYPVGWLADRWGRKRVMVGGLLGQAVLSGAYLVIADPLLFVVLRFVEGMLGATLLPPARALIVDTVPADRRGEAYGLFGAFFNAGFLLGPGIGGLLATTGYASAFIGAVVFRLVAVVIVLTLIPKVGQSATAAEASPQAIPYRVLFTLPLVATYIIAFGDYLYLGFDLTLTPLWMHDHLGASVVVIGIAYIAWAIPSTLLSPIAGRIVDRTRRRSWFILIFGLAQVPIYFAYGLANVAILIVILFAVHGAVYAFVQPSIDAQVAALSASGVRARVQGLYATFGLIGAFVGASGFNALYTINFRWPLFAMGLMYGLCLLTGGIIIRLFETHAHFTFPS
jgi:DHA1 family multidrug resistance protein-like MFS transporter